LSEDDIIYWQDTLDAVVAGKTTELKCPFCYVGEIKVEQKERTTRIECAKCRKYIEGSLKE
jgi:hypothetical protein